jgi:Scaffold protein Nfu/NifU N terminal
MGQPITVVAKRSSNPGILRFETNRVLTGMGHERYTSIDDIVDDRWIDRLARRLFENGGVDMVHVNGNIITVHITDPSEASGITQVVEDLYLYYHEGDPPPTVQGT